MTTPTQYTGHLLGLPGPRPEDFIWAGGVEDTFVPQTRPGHRALDEYQLIGHYEHWREDLALAKGLGLRALRWGVPWYRVEPERGKFDWRWIDEVLPYMVNELGITPIVDLMHYGCPFWLHREFDNPGYPAAVASYAAQFAQRYKGLVRWYTPLNEPLVNALMCGKRGLWPPYLRGDRGYLRVMVQLAKGIIATVRALKEIDPASIMVHVDAAGIVRAERRDLERLATEDQLRHFICYDLITGRVDTEHALFPWLLRNGVSPDDLYALAAGPIDLDVLGLNFYPQWSTKLMYINRQGKLAYRETERQGLGFAEMIATYQQRYHAPVIVTETSARGSDRLRADWLAAGLGAIKALRGQGVPVLGYTWFPLFTMIDWSYRFARGPVEQYRLELGLYRLGRNGEPRWTATPLVEQFRACMAEPEAAIGILAAAPQVAPGPEYRYLYGGPGQKGEGDAQGERSK
jgi:beta-glucosidase/6-phospho-beta-glucosidase/beta-galactosidase